MRFSERDARAIHLRRRGEPIPDAFGEPLAGWDPPEAIRALPQPLTSALDRQAYGQRALGMKRLYLAGGPRIRQGDGLCVAVPGESPPDYRVVAVMDWDAHVEVDAERAEGAPMRPAAWGEGDATERKASRPLERGGNRSEVSGDAAVMDWDAHVEVDAERMEGG